MENRENEIDDVFWHYQFLEKLKKNDVQFPNEFTIEMGKMIKKAREEKGINQTLLAEKISRSQATISDIENGKIEVGILTLVLIAFLLQKPISYFIPEMTFFANVNDIHNKFEEEALTLFRQLENEGFSDLGLKLLQLLNEYNDEHRQDEENWGLPNE
jgi:transcriptional regulator with XRE-family HTH domain